MYNDDITDDPIERDPKYRDIFAKIDAEVTLALRDSQIKEGDLGYCHTFWHKKKEILRKKYKIHWKTPAEMNPFILFD